MSFELSAGLELEIVDKELIKTGEVNNIKLLLKNNSSEEIRFKDEVILPNGWDLLFSLDKLVLNKDQTQILNLFIQVPANTAAGQYPISISFINNQKQIYEKKFILKVKGYYNLDFIRLGSIDRIKDNFKLSFKFNNKGNTIRFLKIVNSSNLGIDKKEIVLEPFEEKIVSLNCTYTEDESSIIKIKAVDSRDKIISLVTKEVDKKVTSKRYKRYKTYLKVEENLINGKETTYNIRSYFSPKSYLEIKNDKINYKHKDDLSTYKVGSNYLPVVKLVKKSKSNFRYSYLNRSFRKNKLYIYTDFFKEVGLGVNNNKNDGLSWEVKLDKDHDISYLVKKRWGMDNFRFNLNNIKENNKNILSCDLEFEVSNDKILKAGYERYFSAQSDIIKYILIETGKKDKQKIIYRLKTINNSYDRTMRSLEYSYCNKQYDYIKDYDIYTKLKFKDNQGNQNKLSLDFEIKNKIMSLNVRGDNLLNNKGKILFEYERHFKNDIFDTSLYLNNIGHDRLNFGGNLNFLVDDNKEIYCNLGLSLDSLNKVDLKKFKLGIELPFYIKVKDKDYKKIKGKVTKIKNSADISFKVNDKRIEVSEEGNFTAELPFDQDLFVNSFDLGPFTGDYFINKKLPFLIKEDDRLNLNFKLIKYGRLKINFHKIEDENNLSFGVKQEQEALLIKIFNRKGTFIKKYNGGSKLLFEKLKPGSYKLLIKKINSPFQYNPSEVELKIKSGKNSVEIYKALNDKHKIEMDSKIEIL